MKTIALGSPGWRPWLGQVALSGGRRRRRLGDAATALTDDTFGQALSAQTAVVDFWSPTCVPCMRSKPIFDDVASNPPGNLFMGTVNADESPATLQKYGVESLPTQIYFVNGTEVNRNEGAFTKDQLLAAIAQLPGPQPAIAAQPSPPDQVMPSPSRPIPVPMPAPVPVAAAPQQPSAPAAPGAPAQSSPTVARQATGGGISTTALLVGGVSVLALGAGILLLSGGR